MPIARRGRRHREVILDLLPPLTLWLLFSWSFIALSGMFEWGKSDHHIHWMLEALKKVSEHGIANVWTPYPQTASLLFYGIFSITGGSPFLFWLAFKSLNIASTLLIFVCTYLVAKDLFGRSVARWLTLVASFLYTFIYFGVFINFVYDPIPVGLLMSALYFFMRDRLDVFGLLIGIGIGMKLFPLLGLAVVLWFLVKERRFGDVGKCMATCSIALLPLLALFLQNPSIFMSTYRWQMGRPPNESLYNLIFSMIGAPFPYAHDPQYRRYYRDCITHSPARPLYGPQIRSHPVPPVSQGEYMTVVYPSDVPVGETINVTISLRAPRDGMFRVRLQTTEFFTNRSEPLSPYDPWVWLKEGDEYNVTSSHQVSTEWVVDHIWIEQGFVQPAKHFLRGKHATADTSIVYSQEHINVTLSVTLTAPRDGTFRASMRTTGQVTSTVGRLVSTPWVSIGAGQNHTFILHHPLWAESMTDEVWIEQEGVGNIDTLSTTIGYYGLEVDRVTVTLGLYRLFDSYMNIGVTPLPEILSQPVDLQPSSEWPIIVQSQIFFLGALVVVIATAFMRIDGKRDVLTALLFLLCAMFVIWRQWSPQYLLWILPLILLWKPVWVSEPLAVVLVVLVSLEYPLSFEGYQLFGLPFLVWIFWGSILMRICILVAICVAAWLSLKAWR